MSCPVHPASTTLTRSVNANITPAVTRRRRGAALLLTLIVVVVLAILSTGAVLGAMGDFRAGRNSLVEQRAFAVAEFGLNLEISRWNRARNLPPPAGMAIGAIDSSNVFVAQGDTARVRVQRLTETTFWVVSVGRASIGNTALEAQRQTHMVVRIAYPTILPGGAIITAGNLTVKGAAEITGRNTNPPNWTQCANLAGRDTFAISYAPGRTLSIQKPEAVTGGTYADPAAADSNTYVRYGTESWNSLVANADITIPGGTFDPEPFEINGTCDLSRSNNWGEPLRNGTGYKPACVDHFPIIYSTGNLRLTRGRGQGVLLVNGSINLSGNFQWYSLIIARDDITKGNGTFDMWGSIMSRNGVVEDGSDIVGNSSFKYSKCAVESALRGSAILTRTKQRGWVQLY